MMGEFQHIIPVEPEGEPVKKVDFLHKAEAVLEELREVNEFPLNRPLPIKKMQDELTSGNIEAFKLSIIGVYTSLKGSEVANSYFTPLFDELFIDIGHEVEKELEGE